MINSYSHEWPTKLSRDSLTDIKKKLPEHNMAIPTMNEHTQHMRKAHSLAVAESTFKTEDSPSSLLSNLSTLPNPTNISSERDFESVLFESGVYSRAFNAAMSHRPNTGFDNASMITNHSTTATVGDPYFDTDTSSTEEDSAANRPEIAPISDPVDRAWRNLHVASVQAICTQSYSTQDPGKLSHNPYDRIHNLQKIDAQWWFTTTEPSVNVPGRSGMIQREHFYPVHRLDEYKPAYTGRSMGTEAVVEGWLRYNEGDRVELKVSDVTTCIHHIVLTKSANIP